MAVSNLRAVPPVALPPAWGINSPAPGWGVSDFAKIDVEVTSGNANSSVKIYYINANNAETYTGQQAAVPPNSVRLAGSIDPPAGGFWPNIGNPIGSSTEYRIKLETATVTKGSVDGQVTRTQ